MKKKILCFYLILIFFLTGCWDKVEIEDRGFLDAVGIDKFDKKNHSDLPSMDKKDKSRYTVTVSLPDIHSIENDEEKSEIIKNATSKTISGALMVMDSYSSYKLYLGQIRLIILGEGILKDKLLFKETLDFLERDTKINNKLIIMSTNGEAKEILSKKITEKIPKGIFISSFYQNNKTTPPTSFKLDFSNLLFNIYENGNAIIPKIQLEEETLYLSGGALVKDFELVSWLDGDETLGYLWLQSNMDNLTLNTLYKDLYTALKINKSKVNVTFNEKNNKIVATVNLKVKGNLEEFGDIDENDIQIIKELSDLYEQIIKEQIEDTFYTFINTYEVDVFGFINLLKKSTYNLYKKYQNNLDKPSQVFILDVNVDLDITGTGSIS